MTVTLGVGTVAQIMFIDLCSVLPQMFANASYDFKMLTTDTALLRLFLLKFRLTKKLEERREEKRKEEEQVIKM